MLRSLKAQASGYYCLSVSCSERIILLQCWWPLQFFLRMFRFCMLQILIYLKVLRTVWFYKVVLSMCFHASPDILISLSGDFARKQS